MEITLFYKLASGATVYFNTYVFVLKISSSTNLTNVPFPEMMELSNNIKFLTYIMVIFFLYFQSSSFVDYKYETNGNRCDNLSCSV